MISCECRDVLGRVSITNVDAFYWHYICLCNGGPSHDDDQLIRGSARLSHWCLSHAQLIHTSDRIIRHGLSLRDHLSSIIPDF